MEKYRHFIFFGVVFLIISLFIWHFITKDKRTNSLKKHGVICDARPTSIRLISGKNKGKLIQYQFIYQGKQYEHSLNAPDIFMTFEDEIFYAKKHVPVLVDTTDPETSHLLLRPFDFGLFGMNFPDSLRWVEKYR